MQEAAKSRVHVTLMGTPCLAGNPALSKAQRKINRDAEALELMAFLLIEIVSAPKAGINPFQASHAYPVKRYSLVEAIWPALLRQDARSAHDHGRYVLEKLNGALSIKRSPKQNTETNSRERSDFGVNLAHVSVDVHQLLIAARHLSREENQDAVVALGAKRLLEGMDYPWMAKPTFQDLRQRLDTHFLDALHCKITSLLIKAEDASLSDQAHEHRSQALLLIEQGKERLRAMGGDHPFAERFRHHHAKATQFTPSHDIHGAAMLASPVPRHNIPRRITSFVGRDAQLAQIKEMLAAKQIVTIHGMGGCGKTRLALQAALDYAERTGEEARLVELAGVADPASVPQTVAHALGLSEQKQRTYEDALVERLQGGRPLLLLDNCEHVIKRCAFLVEHLAQFCPNLIVLATSREPLNIEGEFPVPLDPLPAPPADAHSISDAALLEYEAARMFADRIQPYYLPVSQEDRASVASICACLDGIPLALELAATRAAEFSLPEIATRLADRFGFLIKGRRTALKRHKTLHAVMDWSYDLLTEQERILLCRLAVFAGGWTLDAAQSVGASGVITEPDVPGLLQSLVNKSLVSFETDGGEARYRMLETVRQYAGGKLQQQNEADACSLRHRAFFLRLAEEAGPDLHGSAPERWLDRLETEHDNLRAALAGRADEDAMRLACALHRFWLIRAHFQEGRQWLERAWNSMDDVPVALRAQALAGAGVLAYSQGSYSDAKHLLETSLQLRTAAGDREGRSASLHHLGITATFQGDFAAAERRFQESLALALDAGHEAGIADARQGLGRVAQAQADHERAWEAYASLLPVRRSAGGIAELADILMYMGLVATHQRRCREAEDLLNESLAYATRLGRIHQIAQLTGALADLARVQDDYAATRRYGEQSLALMRKVGASLGIAHILNLLAVVAYESGDYREAEDGFTQAWTILQALDNQMQAAAALTNIATMAGLQGDHERAFRLYRESLEIFVRHDAWPWIANCFEDFGLLEAKHRSGSRAVVLLRASDALRGYTNYARTGAETARFDQALSDLRAALGDHAFASASDAGRAMTKEQAVAFALEQ